MGAKSDSDVQCTRYGDQGQFQFENQGACTATTLAPGATYISDVDGTANFTDPIATVFATVTDATVATPEPSLLALLLCGGLLCLLYRLRTPFVLPSCRGCAGTRTT